MPYVLCEVSEGLRSGERTVAVRSVQGGREFLRVEAGALHHRNGNAYLPVGVVRREPKGYTLIELPQESDSGANRLWVANETLLEEADTGVPA